LANALSFYPAEADYISPGGASKIRQLIQRAEGQITHATCPAGSVSTPAIVAPPDEVYYVLAGGGWLWRRHDEHEGVSRLSPGRWATIPAGSAFQFRSDVGCDLVVLVLVVPQWKPEHYRTFDVGGGGWDDHGSLETDSRSTAEPWHEGTTPIAADYSAPDGSEIRLVTQVAGGSIAHCTLRPGAVSKPVRHESVNEIWFVLGGHGALWRLSPRGEGWVTPLRHGVCVDIEAGEAFQFRSTGGVSRDSRISVWADS
jgi:mannose-6-phosphate isomerase-like protein (cupin superfamily)